MNEHASIGQAAEGAMPSNPYLSATHAEPLPELDAGPPLLRPVEQQRINRKALGFLAGIVLFLVLMTLWMVHSATAGKDAKPRQREEAVVIPDLPRVSQGVASAGPPAAESAQAQDVPPLPVLPPPPVDTVRMPPPTVSQPTPPTLMERRMGVVATEADAVPQPA
ncbi:MAG TPA: hypothetical protein VFF93_10735, partial [Luteimonas sp.]|nr:hypothetical protein [Luteimonas sp.]